MNPVLEMKIAASCGKCDQSNSRLCAAVERFWNRPGDWADPVRLPKWYADYENTVLTGVYAMRRLREKLYSHIGLSNSELKTDFSDVSSRILLLGRETVHKIVSLSGLTVFSKKIAAMVAGTEIRCIVRELGEESWRFAVSRAGLFGNLDWIRPVISEVEGSWVVRINSAGMQTVALAVSCARTGTPGLLQKFFPVDDSLPSCAACPEHIRVQAWELVRKITLQELAPQWKNLLS